MVYSNIVRKDQLRKIQLSTLDSIKNALIPSFGPMGSNTVIKKGNSLTMYTKDGHTILSNIIFNGVIEQSIKDDIQEQTRQIVLEYGDGTTSAIILSDIIFRDLIKLEDKYMPYDIVATFKSVVKDIAAIIKSNARENVTLDDIYNIALISTNNNEDIASMIKVIYENYGMNVFIDVGISNTTENLVKVYDGMTLETGYSDTIFINDIEKGIARIRDAHIYIFEDPIDTPEMAAMFDAIVAKNIIQAYNKNATSIPVPTVIMAPKMSKDMSATMDSLTNFIASCPNPRSKPPFLLITDIHQYDQFMDIARLCGAIPIHKYLNPDIQQKDIERGLAPTPDTICDFCGFAEIVESDISKTKFVNPAKMYNENGDYSNEYTSLITYLEAELNKAKEEGEDANVTGNLKRRINSLKANMVEYLVGGVSVADRDSTRALVEDAVLACRSAAANGVGYGANFEGLRASAKLDNDKYNIYGELCIETDIIGLIADAYYFLSRTLYMSNGYSKDKAESIINRALPTKDGNTNGPFNIRTEEYDHKVLASIKADIVVLDVLSKIITLMATSNQFLTTNPMTNTYYAEDQLD